MIGAAGRLTTALAHTRQRRLATGVGIGAAGRLVTVSGSRAARPWRAAGRPASAPEGAGPPDVLVFGADAGMAGLIREDWTGLGQMGIYLAWWRDSFALVVCSRTLGRRSAYGLSRLRLPCPLP